MILTASLILSAALLPPRPVPASPVLVAGGVGVVFYVDDDHPGDPGPGDALLSNPLEDGSQLYPFDSVQEALDSCADTDTVQIEAGLYTESMVVRGSGCRLVGRGQGVTVLSAASGELLSRQWWEPGTVALSLEHLTLRNGLVSVRQGDYLAIGQARFSDVDFESSRLGASSFDGQLTLDLVRVSMAAGTIEASPSTYGYLIVKASHLIAPETRIRMPAGATPSTSALELEDSVVAGIEAMTPTEGALRMTLKRVSVSPHGIIASTAGGQLIGVTLEDCDITGLLRIRDIAAWYSLGLDTEISILHTRFREGGVSLETGTPPAPSYGSIAGPGFVEMNVISSTFLDSGVAVTVWSGTESEDLALDLVLQNNTFKSAVSGLDLSYLTDEAPGETTGRIESQLEIVNNTFSGNDTGIKLTTTPHTPGLHSLETLIKNNIIAGGRTGIEVRGLDDHTITVENNDVLGRPDGRYRGDLPDQTGRNGNISLPPWFRGPNDVRLQRISPCIDRGGFGPEVPGTDIEGRARPLDGNGDGFIAPDMGAYELPGLPDRPAGGTKPK